MYARVYKTQVCIYVCYNAMRQVLIAKCSYTIHTYIHIYRRFCVFIESTTTYVSIVIIYMCVCARKPTFLTVHSVEIDNSLYFP